MLLGKYLIKQGNLLIYVGPLDQNAAAASVGGRIATWVDGCLGEFV